MGGTTGEAPVATRLEALHRARGLLQGQCACILEAGPPGQNLDGRLVSQDTRVLGLAQFLDPAAHLRQ